MRRKFVIRDKAVGVIRDKAVEFFLRCFILKENEMTGLSCQSFRVRQCMPKYGPLPKPQSPTIILISGFSIFLERSLDVFKLSKII